MNWLDKYRVIRRLTLFWAASLITYTVLVALDDLTLITTPVASVVASVVGIMAVVVGFYVKGRFKEND